jgi:hypothetical protein
MIVPAAPIRPNPKVLPTFVILLLLFCIFQIRSCLTEVALNVFDDTPLSHRYHAEHYNFSTTDLEAACLAGVSDPKQTPIPNVVHFVLGLENADIEFPAYLAIRAALRSIQPDTLKLHHTGGLNVDNEYIQALLMDEKVKVVSHSLKEVSAMTGSNHYAHLADILRLKVLYGEGGIYLDSDVFALKSFADLRRAPLDVVLGHEGGDRNGLCNAIILARPEAAFIKRWLDSYSTFREGEWNDHSVLLPKQWSIENPSEVCTLSPHAFFWPTWTRRHVRWMHEPISDEESIRIQDMLEDNNGSLYDGQLAYHAWNQISWKPYLSQLSDPVVAQEKTRFNIMVRRFLDSNNWSRYYSK